MGFANAYQYNNLNYGQLAYYPIEFQQQVHIGIAQIAAANYPPETAALMQNQYIITAMQQYQQQYQYQIQMYYNQATYANAAYNMQVVQGQVPTPTNVVSICFLHFWS
jgi:hypothetical protein